MCIRDRGSVFAGLIAFLWPLATLYALEYMRKEQRKSEFFAYYTMTYGVTAGVALAGNLLTMYLFYEMLTLVTFPPVSYTHLDVYKRQVYGRVSAEEESKSRLRGH